MSNYIPNQRKKLRICRQREAELRRLLAQGAAEPKLLAAAELLGNARVRVLRAKKAKLSPLDVTVSAKIDSEIAVVAAMTAESVLAEFRE